jgi:hypothetical protein
VVDQKKIGDLGIAFIDGRPQNNGGVEENGKGGRGCRIAKGDGVTRRANRVVVRSVGWIDPEVVVGMGRRSQVQVWKGEARRR